MLDAKLGPGEYEVAQAFTALRPEARTTLLKRTAARFVERKDSRTPDALALDVLEAAERAVRPQLPRWTFSPVVEISHGEFIPVPHLNVKLTLVQKRAPDALQWALAPPARPVRSPTHPCGSWTFGMRSLSQPLVQSPSWRST